MNKLNDYFSSQEEWEKFLAEFNVRKIQNKFDKAWIQKIKGHYRIFGWDMNLYADQKRRMEMILEKIKEAK